MFLLAFFASLYATVGITIDNTEAAGNVFTYAGVAADKAVTLKWGTTGTPFPLGTTVATTFKVVFGWAKLEEFLATAPATAAVLNVYEADTTEPFAWIPSGDVKALTETALAVVDGTKVSVTGVTSDGKFYYHEGAAAGTSASAALTVVPIPASALRPKTYLYEYTSGAATLITKIHIVSIATASARSAATHATEKKKVVVTDTLGSNVTLPVAITGVEITDTHNSGFVKATIAVTAAVTTGVVGTGKWVYTSSDAAADLPASYKVVPCTGGATSNAWVCTATAIQVGTPPAAGAKGVFASFILLIAAVLLL